MKITLPDSLAGFVDEQVASRGFRSRRAYVLDLVRRDQDRQRLRALLVEGAASPDAGALDRTYFADLRRRARRRSPTSLPRRLPTRD